MCIKQLFFGGVVADVGVIAITVVGIIVGHKKCTYQTLQHNVCKFSTYMTVASLLEAKSRVLYSV